MRTAVRTAALAVLAATAAAGSVLNGLPDCWDSCSSFVAGEDCSWYDAGCICDLADNGNYLSATITCARKTCGSDWDPSDVGRFLAPIEFTCSLEGGVSQGRLDAASSAAAEAATTSVKQSPKTTAEQTSTKPSKTRTSQAAETTLRATIVQSSSTAVVDQPVSFGSSGFSSGARSTSIIVSTIEIVPVPVSSAGTTTAGGIVQQTGSPTSTPDFQPTSATESSTSSAAPRSTNEAGGGGTLFDSTGDGSSNSIAGLVIAAYVVAVALIHAL